MKAMLISKPSLFTLLLVSAVIGTCLASLETSLPIYDSVVGFPCVTLSDKNGLIGCRSSRSGDNGPLWPLNNQQDIDSFVDGSMEGIPRHTKLMLLVDSSVFTKENVQNLLETSQVAGILVTVARHQPKVTNAPPQGFSPVSKFPNREFGLHSDQNLDWNPLGDSFAFENFNIPIYSLDGRYSSSFTIVERAAENRERKGKYPLWGVGMHSWMFANDNSVVCMRRGYCEPLGGKSVWGTFQGGVQATKKNLILSIATMDSNAFFHDQALGANSAMSGTIATLLAAHALSSHKEALTDFPNQIVFALFTGESWGYIGSRKFISDIQTFECKKVNKDDPNRCDKPFKASLEFKKLELSKISNIIELNQVGNLTETNGKNALYAHQESQYSANAGLISLLQNLAEDNTNVTVANAETPAGWGIPPSSMHSWLKLAFPAPNSQVASVVLAEHAAQYKNKYYHSRFDSNFTTNPQQIADAATVLARALYVLARGNTLNTTVPQDLVANADLARDLMGCLTEDFTCDLVRHYFPNVEDSQPSQYTSVFRSNAVMSQTALLVHDLLYNFTSTYVGGDCNKSKDCDDESESQGVTLDCVGGKCMASGTYFHDAVSLAFGASGDGVKPNDQWETDSTWAESVWSGTYMDSYRMDDPVAEVVTLVFGILEVLVSVGVVWFARKHFTRQFKSP